MLGAGETPGLVSRRFYERSDLLLLNRLGRLQFLHPCFQSGPLGYVLFLNCLELVLDLRQLFPQPLLRLLVRRQFSLQFAPAFVEFARLPLRSLPTPGLLSQLFRQLLDLLLDRHQDALQFLGARFQLGLFGKVNLLLRLLLLLRVLQLLPRLCLGVLVLCRLQDIPQVLLRLLPLLPQLRLGLEVCLGFLQLLPQASKLGFQFAPPLAHLARLLFGALPTLALLGKRLGQPLDLLLHLRLGQPQFLGSCLQPGLFGFGALLLRLQLSLRCLQPLPHLPQLAFQTTPLLANLVHLLLSVLPAHGLGS